MTADLPTLTFVYNADSGLLSGARDLMHKLVRTPPAPCGLYAVTHDTFGLRADWRRAVEALPVAVAFLHRDEFHHLYPSFRHLPLPAALYDDGLSGPQALLGADEWHQFDLPALIATVRRRVRERSAVLC